MKKRIAFVLAALLAATTVTGCQSTPAASSASAASQAASAAASSKVSSEPVTLKWVMCGPGEQEDTQKVFAEVNKKLKTYEGMENVTLDIETFPGSDYKQKFTLMQTGGEQLDIIQTYRLDYTQLSREGTLMPLDDLLKNTADLKSALPDWFWEYGKVDGKTYIVPNYQELGALLLGIRTSQDYADKYMDQKAVQELFLSKEFFDQDCYNAVEDYLKKLKDNNLLGLGFYSGYNEPTKGYEMVKKPFCIRRNTTEGKFEIVNLYKTDEMKLYFKTMADWYKKGYIRKDALSAADSTEQRGKKNGITVWFGEVNTSEQEAKMYDYTLTNLSIDNHYYVPISNAAGGTGIYSKSVSPETAIKVIELMNSEKGKELYNMVCYGMEGVHYKVVSNNVIETIEGNQQATSGSKYGLYTWVVGNRRNEYVTRILADAYGGYDKYVDFVYNYINNGKDTIYSKISGFVPNVSSFSAKYDQLNAIVKEYVKTLSTGAIENWETTYDEFCSKMDKAEESMMRDELQKQLNEFLKTKK